MWEGQHKSWSYLQKDIIAADKASALFLSDYLRHINIHKIYLNSLEVADLQHYKLHKTPLKVKKMITEGTNTPFVFILCRN
jgi:hypothetical protein